MKNEPWEWNEKDLLDLIYLAQSETLELDYKHGDALKKNDKSKNEISKDISAFANSAGGTIIYGIEEKGHLPQKIAGALDPSEITREWVEQVINSRIQRRISGVRVNQILLNQTSPGKVAYVVHVPQSHQAPHQAADKKFYKRFNFESVPMEESEIRDVSNRISAPNIELDFHFGGSQQEIPISAGAGDFYEPVLINASVRNTSSAVAPHAVFHLLIDQQILVPTIPDGLISNNDVETIKFDEKEVRFAKYTSLWDDKRGLPLFDGISAEVLSNGVEIVIPLDATILFLRHVIGAPGMNTKHELSCIFIDDDSAKIQRITTSKTK